MRRRGKGCYDRPKVKKTQHGNVDKSKLKSKEEQQKIHDELMIYYYANDWNTILLHFKGSIVNMIEVDFVKYHLMKYAADTISDIYVDFYERIMPDFNPKDYPGIHLQGWIQQRFLWRVMYHRNKIIKRINKEYPNDYFSKFL